MGEQLVVGGDIILKVQGMPGGEAADHGESGISWTACLPAASSR
jgi:hypothetical protein